MAISKTEIANLIAVQKKIISNTQIDSGLREIFNTNLQVLKTLVEENNRLSSDATVGEMRKIYSSKMQEKEPLVEMIKEVQGYLSSKHPELVNECDINPNARPQLETIIANYVIEHNLDDPSFKGRDGLIKFLISELLGLSVLDEALNKGKEMKNPIQEIQVNALNDIRFIIDGEVVQTDLAFRNYDHIRLFADRLSRASHKITGQAEFLSDEKNFIRLRYQESTRISIMSSPIAHDDLGRGTIQMAIRMQQDMPFTTEFLLSKGSVDVYTDELMTLLCKYVSVVAYGGTGTGKTAMLRKYLNQIPADRRIITMAETDEMNLRRIDTRRFIKNSAGKDVENPEYLRSLNSVLMWECPDPKRKIAGDLMGISGMVNASLTFTPEVIVVQESKSGEIKDIIDAAVSGHQIFTTIHADSPEAFFIRILLMYQQAAANISDVLIQKQIPLAFPVIVNFKRYADSSRKIAEITELVGYDAVTFQPITRPLVQFVVTRNVVDPKTHKLKTEGNFYANLDGFLSPRLLKILRDRGAQEKEINRVEALYKKTLRCEFKNGVAMV